jgi:Protein of unknown function (DUF3592)
MHARTVLYLLNSRGVYALLAVTGVAIGLFAGREFIHLKRVETEFVETPAELVSAKVERHVTRYRRAGYRVRYRPEVVYQYPTAAGLQTGTEVAWHTPQFDTEAAAEEYLAGLWRNGQTVCYVDPDDPATAVLDRHVDRTPFTMIATFAGAFFLAGVFGYLARLWFRSSQPVRPRVGWNDLDPEVPHGERPIVLSATPPPANDPLARTRALMAEYDGKRGTVSRP